MTSARFRPFCRKNKINIGYYDGSRLHPRNITERKIALKMNKHHFSLIWKSNGINFSQAIEDLKNNFKFVESVISD